MIQKRVIQYLKFQKCSHATLDELARFFALLASCHDHSTALMKRLFGVDGAADFLALFNTFASSSSSFFPTFNSSRILRVLLIKSCGGSFWDVLGQFGLFTVSETPQKKDSKRCVFIVYLILSPHDLNGSK